MPHDFATLDIISALESLAAPAYAIDRDGRIRWQNRAYVEFFGDQHGQRFVDHVTPDHRQVARSSFATTTLGRTSTIFDLALVDPSGGRIMLRVTAAPLRRNGEVVGSVGIGIPFARASAPERSRLEDLTPRQQEVLRLLAEGLETQEIARRLGVVEETARNHIRALLRASGAHSRLEAVLLAMRLGVVGPHLTKLHSRSTDE